MKCNLFPFLCYSLWGGGGGGGISGRVRALNLTVLLGSGRVGSGRVRRSRYGPGSGFSSEPVQTSSLGAKYEKVLPPLVDFAILCYYQESRVL